MNDKTVKTYQNDKLTLMELIGIMKVQIEIFVVWRHVKVVLDMGQGIIP